MGGGRKKSKKRRKNEKKFVFEWEAPEDNSDDINPLYAHKHDVLLFGRGMIAGIDVKEQKRQRSKFYDDLLERRRNVEEKDRAGFVSH